MKTTLLMPKYPKIIKQKEENRAIFEIENCYPGYGMTLGNAFRRVLLSSLPGAAVTVVKIKGAEHEFSTLPYVLEDVIEIILNLKQIRFKFYAQESVVLTLKAKGEKMPTRKSAIKNLKKNEIRHTRNKAVRSELKTRDKTMKALLGEKKLDEAKSCLKTYITKLDKAASKKIIHKKKVSRKSSRLMKKLNSLTSASTT